VPFAASPSCVFTEQRWIGARPPRPGTPQARQWPGARLLQLPSSPDEMSLLISQVSTWWEVKEATSLDVLGAFASLGWPLVRRRLGAREDSHRAMLLPQPTGGFVVLLDPDLAPAEKAMGLHRSEATRLRLIHELAHSFFYSGGTPPTRLLSGSPEEEQFCDEFAQSWLLRSGIAA
jgi:hypothetical protein